MKERLLFFWRNCFAAFSKKLGEAHDEIQGSPNLVRHVGDEFTLASYGILKGGVGRLEFLVALCRLFYSCIEIADMAAQRFLHLCKTVLQVAHDAVFAAALPQCIHGE